MLPSPSLTTSPQGPRLGHLQTQLCTSEPPKPLFSVFTDILTRRKHTAPFRLFTDVENTLIFIFWPFSHNGDGAACAAGLVYFNPQGKQHGRAPRGTARCPPGAAESGAARAGGNGGVPSPPSPARGRVMAPRKRVAGLAFPMHLPPSPPPLSPSPPPPLAASRLLPAPPSAGQRRQRRLGPPGASEGNARPRPPSVLSPPPRPWSCPRASARK